MSYKRWIACGDNHGDQMDSSVEAAFFKFLELWKPHYKIHLGDNWDLRSLRSKASLADKNESILADLDAGDEFLEKYVPDIFMEGNHCSRPYRLLQEGGIAADFGKGIIERRMKLFKKLKIKHFPYHKREGIFRLGSLGFIHGFATGPNAALIHARAYDNVIGGHVHTSQEAVIPNLSPRHGWSCPCMAFVDMPYLDISIQSLGHCNGWDYGVVFDNGTFDVFPAKRINNRYFVSKEFIEL